MPQQTLLRSLLATTLLSTLALAAPTSTPKIPSIQIVRASGNSTADALHRRDNGEVNWTSFCSKTVYFMIAGPDFSIGPYTLNYGDYSVNQQPPISGAGNGGTAGGYSAKFSYDQNNWSNVYQLEYASDGTYVWYDFSAQNGDPFVNDGSSIWPAGGDYGSAPQDCQSVICNPGSDASCAYQGTDPSGPVHHCTVDTTINAYLCPDNQSDN